MEKCVAYFITVIQNCDGVTVRQQLICEMQTNKSMASAFSVDDQNVFSTDKDAAIASWPGTRNASTVYKKARRERRSL